MIYDYKCPECGRIKEVMTKPLDTPEIPSCDNCGLKMERQYHAVPVHFKGSGFYTTDYKKKERKKK